MSLKNIVKCCLFNIKFIILSLIKIYLCFGESDNLLINNNFGNQLNYNIINDLNYSSLDKYHIKAIDEFEIIDSILTQRDQLHGLAMGGGYLWVVRSHPTIIDSILKIDYKNKKIIGGYELPGNLSNWTQDIVYDSLSQNGPFIWCSDDIVPGLIYKFELKNKLVVQQFQSPDEWPDGIAMKDSIMWISGSYTYSLFSLNINSGVFKFLFLAPKHCGKISLGKDYSNDLFLWMSANNYNGEINYIYKINLVTGGVFQTFKPPGKKSSGLTFDEESPNGPYLWIVDFETGIIYKLKEKYKDIRDNVPFKLYPNPFQDLITFEFILENDEYVSVSIYNLLGQFISVPVHDFLDAGSHKIPINFTGFAQGVYYYRYQAGDRVETGKLVLIK